MSPEGWPLVLLDSSTEMIAFFVILHRWALTDGHTNVSVAESHRLIYVLLLYLIFGKFLVKYIFVFLQNSRLEQICKHLCRLIFCLILYIYEVPGGFEPS